MRLNVRERILFYAKRDEATRCWNWQGSIDSDGYGRINYPPFMAYRVAYEQFVGPVPDGLVIDHLCRNRACVNPEHLEPVTVHENSLRGATATKTHCVNGHEFDSENTRITVRNGVPRRNCRACARAGSRRYRERKMATASEELA